jgi:Protein of unknown function (DUF4242)
VPRYLVQRTFSEGLHIPTDDEGAKSTRAVVDANAGFGVTWVQSYVSSDKSVSYCLYDGPSPEAIRQAAQCNGLPADQPPRSASSTRTSTTEPAAGWHGWGYGR